MGPNGEQLPIGKSIDRLLVYFEQESGLRFERRQLPWNRAQLMAREGEGIIYGFSKSPQRLQIYHFSLPVVTGKVWVISYGEPAPVFLSAQDLKGKVLSIGRGFSHGMEFEKAKNVLFTVQEDSASEAARFKKLVAKHSEVMLWQSRDLDTAEQVSLYIQKTLIPSFNDAQLRDKVFNVSIQPMFYDSMHFASAKGKYEAEMAILDQVIRRGVKNGSLAKALHPN
ncbi:substrate-binding periplasmic protein [Undibacterium sp. Ren11W]|uniref:substrate-binding periplasmic protein n=1 Tax=Undibacterium sp. Ren11W TaxID=3413045 RepID=UPI003BF5086A